ncbi:Leucine-rich repeat-containing protein [Actinidia chinensis var. chinensis]|uniref:Leucine-rich repeat-containing protein n=1 Tax=Actinidia chinensis var. chinensis TaxID=1590841 RepID=A0A2R6R8V2_ACTCC|nr:Leucine-rich repeat-containing protein [Actinidia chinensis var. chinensis]
MTFSFNFQFLPSIISQTTILPFNYFILFFFYFHFRFFIYKKIYDKKIQSTLQLGFWGRNRFLPPSSFDLRTRTRTRPMIVKKMQRSKAPIRTLGFLSPISSTESCTEVLFCPLRFRERIGHSCHLWVVVK